MAATAATVRVHGLAELNRALKKMGGDLPKETRQALLKAGEPTRIRAESLAHSVGHNTDRWSAMRLGSTTRVVYIAPKARRRRGTPRPNFGTMLMEEAMIPALEQTEPGIIVAIDEMLYRLGDKAGF